MAATCHGEQVSDEDGNPVPYHNDVSPVAGLRCFFAHHRSEEREEAEEVPSDHASSFREACVADTGPYRHKTAVVVQESRDDAQVRGKLDMRGFPSCLSGWGDG